MENKNAGNEKGQNKEDGRMAKKQVVRKPVTKDAILDRVFKKDPRANIWVYRQGTKAWQAVPAPWQETALEMIIIEGDYLIDRWVRMVAEDDWKQCPSAVIENAWQVRGADEWTSHWAGPVPTLAAHCQESLKEGSARDDRMASGS